MSNDKRRSSYFTNSDKQWYAEHTLLPLVQPLFALHASSACQPTSVTVVETHHNHPQLAQRTAHTHALGS